MKGKGHKQVFNRWCRKYENLKTQGDEIDNRIKMSGFTS